MFDLIIELSLFFLALFIVMPLMLVLAVLLHAVTDHKNKQGLWHKEDAEKLASQ